MQELITCLWFDSEAEEAAGLYTSVFENAEVLKVHRFLEAGKEIHGRDAGTVMTVDFRIGQRHFVALNGGPMFKFSEAISLQVMCESQEEVDYYWERLSEGGDPQAQQCGWLKDRFGLSWQVVPTVLPKLLGDPDRERANRVMQAMLAMKKLDIAALKAAGARA
jgi:predicted 3-demethylubiquinone-9 3-methyltransferase (glyoxalase superfamily)